MRRMTWLAMLALLGLGCGKSPPSSLAPSGQTAEPQPQTEPPSLDEVVAGEAVFFEPGTLPPALVERMARQRVVMLGEHHGYREHQDLLIQVVRTLHRHGARWVLFEGFQAESWSVDAYLNGNLDGLSPATAKYFGYPLAALRAFNLTVPEGERLHAAFIDINHRTWALPLALSRLVDHVGALPCLETFLAESSWDRSRPLDEAQAAFEKAHAEAPDAYGARLKALAAKLRDGSCFAGPSQHRTLQATLTEMADVAIDSLRIREIWDRDGEDAAHPAREETIKTMLDRRLQAAEAGPVVLNMGGYHLQKTHVMGTEKQWVGEHLAKPSHPAAGSVLRLFVQFARAERKRGGDGGWWDLSDEPREGELLSALHRHAGGRAAFLPLDHPRLSGDKIPVSYMHQVVEHVPGAAFDGYVLLPVGHKLY